jgi:16S rRNA (adenine1518-N6/adenine1519-N6)-dimethyltransferase
MKRLLAESGVRPSRVRGQNFLVDASLMQFIADSARLDSRDIVLEPGVGAGNLTTLLASRCARVVAVEIDRALHGIASERLSSCLNVRLIHSDILQRGERIAPEVALAVEDALARLPDSRLKVVANLPYMVSTAFITAALLDGPVPERMIVMLQKEVADRITAAPGGKEYGYLSVVVQAVSRAGVLRRVPPGAFWPPPEVESAIVEIVPDPALRAEAGDLGRLRSVASALFQHRRKQLGRVLIMSEFARDRDHAAGLLSEVGATPKDRAETLSVAQIVQLAATLPAEGRQFMPDQ